MLWCDAGLKHQQSAVLYRGTLILKGENVNKLLNPHNQQLCKCIHNAVHNTEDPLTKIHENNKFSLSKMQSNLTSGIKSVSGDMGTDMSPAVSLWQPV